LKGENYKKATNGKRKRQEAMDEKRKELINRKKIMENREEVTL